MKRSVYWMTACLMALTAACGHDHDEASPAEDACEHMIEGPSAAITAVPSDATTDAPAIDKEHTRFDITLVDEEGVNGGLVSLVIDEAGDHILFLGAAVSITLTDSAGNEVTPEATQSNVPECSEVSVSHTFDLGVGTYTLRFESAQETMVHVVLVADGDHHHD